MESLTIQESLKNRTHNAGNVENESSEQFQNFIYELFDRNGVLNDLRAYLRGRIVHVLNSAQSGEPPLCQKRFVQRLDVTMQAVNAIITEYLLKQEFQYSLSVFLSEIPLTNMVFEFTKSLLNHKTPAENSCLKFTEKDIYSIFNFLGIKCDSTDIEQIVKMYNNPEGPPLLLCIFKYIQLHQTPTDIQVKDCVTEEHKKMTEIQIPKFLHGKCRHHSACKNCQTRYEKLRQKYIKKNKEFKLVFMQMKASYDSEIELVREEERAKADDVLKAQAEHLEEQIRELQQRYSDHEAALERDAEQTRRFVRGLARRLRARLATVLNAATALRDERRRLNIKEENLKKELTLAEEILSSQGEELKTEISNELAALEGHLDAMKRERDTINKERAELEIMKQKNDDQKKDQILQINYELMKEELAILKEHLKTIKSPSEIKQTVNKEVLTEECGMSYFNFSQNNEQNYNNTTQGASDSKNSAKIVYNNDMVSDPPKKVVNDFRKEKNVNITTDAQVQSKLRVDTISVIHNTTLVPKLRFRRDFTSKVIDTHTIYLHIVGKARTGTSGVCGGPENVIVANDVTRIAGQIIRTMVCRRLTTKAAGRTGTHLEYLAAQQAKLRADLESRPNPIQVPLPMHCLPKQTTTICDLSSMNSSEDAMETELSVPLPAARAVSTTAESTDEVKVTRAKLNIDTRLRQFITISLRPARIGESPDSNSAALAALGGNREGGITRAGCIAPSPARRLCRDISTLRALIYATYLKRETLSPEDHNDRSDPNDTHTLLKAERRPPLLEIEAEAVEDAYLDLKKRHAERVTSLQLENCQQALKKSQEPLISMFGATRIHPTKHAIKPVSYFHDTKDLFHLQHKVDFNVRGEHSASLKRSLVINKNSKTKVRNPTEKLVETLRHFKYKAEKVHDKNLLETPLAEFRKYYYASESLKYKPTPETSKLENISKTYPVFKDTATSPIAFLNTARVSKMASTSPKKSSHSIEKVQSDIKNLENTLKKMYVNNIITDESDVTSRRRHEIKHEGENIECNSSKKLDKLNVPDNLKVIEKESSKEQEIRQVDLTTLRDDNSSTYMESELHRPQSLMQSMSIGSDIKNTENKSEELLNDLLSNDQSVCVNECDAKEKLIDVCKKPNLDSENEPALSPNLQFNATNDLIDSNENEKKWIPKENAETDLTTNSPDKLTDVTRSDSPLSLEKYSSVDDNFWQ
ncbi:hypothetical protein EVAR_40019_1 [Eumeta japonica]|uniref:Uncharacterized protein n=1 Tax=Eumeta variegata TaxID=151549 RepID=A0A4C1YMD2_EUMVA|nr:hypothetical protein EVAR_40019_1 [Eumeta japonica]